MRQMTMYISRNLIASLAGIFSVAVVAPVAAQTATLEGGWTGGGTVHLSNGKTERASCKANFKKNGGSAYTMNASCATASGRVEQTAELNRTGGNKFSGDFSNAQYGVSGSISITVNGNSLNASLSGAGASASMNLTR
jgi:hypothetical protein